MADFIRRLSARKSIESYESMSKTLLRRLARKAAVKKPASQRRIPSRPRKRPR
jgi:predicted transcriptional regulator